MIDPTTHPDNAQQKRLVLDEPTFGWSREVYERELSAYVEARGRQPQTVTMHPETAVRLGLNHAPVDLTPAPDEPLVVTSSDYARQTITLYY